MSKQDSSDELFYYTVCFPEYDSWNLLHGRLYEVRHHYFESSIASQETIIDYSEGLPAKYSHAISRWGMRWKKRLNGRLREYSCADANGGCAILMQDEKSCAYGKMVFGKDLNWEKSYYYQKEDASRKPQFLLERMEEENAITFVEYDKEGEEISVTKLVGCPFFQGKAEQSLLNNRIGIPRICASTSEGDFCYHAEEKAEKYMAFLEKLQNGEQSLRPVWNAEDIVPKQAETDWYQPDTEQEKTYARNDPEGALPPLEELGSLRLCLFQPDGTEEEDAMEANFSLEENERWREEDWMDEMLSEELQDALEEQQATQEPEEHKIVEMPKSTEGLLERELSFSICDPEPPRQELLPEEEEAQSAPVSESSSYAANREVFHVDVPRREEEFHYEKKETLPPDLSQTMEPPDNDVKEIIEIIQNIESTHPATPTSRKARENEPEYSKEMRTLFASGKMPSRYNVAGKKRNSEMMHAPSDIFRKNPDHASEESRENSDPMVATITAAKQIVISAEESYLYFGQVIDGLRHGRGRTQTEEGLTAYEGNYRDDMRDGFGTYYYKSGKLCYAGDWRENKRDGVGVSFHSSDGAIHVGHWKEDKPIGTSAIFDREGNLQFAGKIENGERQGAGVAYRAIDGTVFVGKWKDDLPTGEGSAFDSKGNLIYTGMWKNGKRHGTGTEFASDGRVVFTGEWKDDQYASGILYKRIENSDEVK